jgi:hypothetical protein
MRMTVNFGADGSLAIPEVYKYAIEHAEDKRSNSVGPLTKCFRETLALLVHDTEVNVSRTVSFF